MKDAHTSTPWEFVVKDDKYGEEPLIVGHSDSEDLPVVCGCLSSQADADLIVLAVNSHEALVEALELINQASLAVNDFRRTSLYAEAMPIVRAALALAKGEQPLADRGEGEAV